MFALSGDTFHMCHLVDHRQLRPDIIIINCVYRRLPPRLASSGGKYWSVESFPYYWSMVMIPGMLASLAFKLLASAMQMYSVD